MISRRQRLKQIAACAALPLLAPPPNNQGNDDNLFHWEHLRPAIAEDVEVAKKRSPFQSEVSKRHCSTAGRRSTGS